VNLEPCEPSREGCDRPRESGRRGGSSGGGGDGGPNAPSEMTGVLAGLGLVIGMPLSRPARGEVGLPGPP
jgi:hypothetical protein